MDLKTKLKPRHMRRLPTHCRDHACLERSAIQPILATLALFRAAPNVIVLLKGRLLPFPFIAIAFRRFLFARSLCFDTIESTGSVGRQFRRVRGKRAFALDHQS
jgi:hypothetical protein